MVCTIPSKNLRIEDELFITKRRDPRFRCW